MNAVIQPVLHNERRMYRIKYGNGGAASHAGTIEDAKRILKNGGFVPGYYDGTAIRYTMPMDTLQQAYKMLENFVADCTQQEYDENKQAINAVITLLHKHIQSNY